MAFDYRVPMDPLLSAFGVPATVTRPAPDDTPIPTTVIWDTPGTMDVGMGGLKRREAREVLGLPKSQVPAVPRTTRIVAPRVLGEAVRTWRVDGTDRVMDDMTYVVVVEESVE